MNVRKRIEAVKGVSGVAEYEGKLYVRRGRRVLVVLAADTDRHGRRPYRVNEVRHEREQAVVNAVLEAVLEQAGRRLACGARQPVLDEQGAPVVDAEGRPVLAPCAFYWVLIDGTVAPFTPREVLHA